MEYIKLFEEFINETAVHYPYQINDKRGIQLYDKAAIALDDEKWTKRFDISDENYREQYPLKEFLKKTKMSMKELEELMDDYGDESWAMYLSQPDEDTIYIEHD